jgi:polyphenol oxidase
MSDLDLRPFAFDGVDGVRAVVTTRHGGVSGGPYATLNLGDHVGDDHEHVLANRRRLARELDVAAVTIADQQHQAACALVTAELVGSGFAGAEEARRFFPATDGLVTDVPGAALGVLAADCAPVVLRDPVRRAIGVAHVGRAGVMRGVLGVTVGRMADQFGSRPADLVVGIGPCVGFESYEVGDREAAALDSLLPGAGLTRPSRTGHRLLDLGGAVERQLSDLGVPSDQVHRMAVDTRTATDTYFSDRAQRPCGRMMAVIALPA